MAQGSVVPRYLVQQDAYKETVADIDLALFGGNTEADVAYLEALVLLAHKQLDGLMQVLPSAYSHVSFGQDTVSQVSQKLSRNLMPVPTTVSDINHDLHVSVEL